MIKRFVMFLILLVILDYATARPFVRHGEVVGRIYETGSPSFFIKHTWPNKRQILARWSKKPSYKLVIQFEGQELGAAKFEVESSIYWTCYQGATVYVASRRSQILGGEYERAIWCTSLPPAYKDVP